MPLPSLPSVAWAACLGFLSVADWAARSDVSRDWYRLLCAPSTWQSSRLLLTSLPEAGTRASAIVRLRLSRVDSLEARDACGVATGSTQPPWAGWEPLPMLRSLRVAENSCLNSARFLTTVVDGASLRELILSVPTVRPTSVLEISWWGGGAPGAGSFGRFDRLDVHAGTSAVLCSLPELSRLGPVTLAGAPRSVWRALGLLTKLRSLDLCASDIPPAAASSRRCRRT